MGQCVSRKAGAVVAASGHHNSPSYRIMDKAQKQGSSKRGTSQTRGTAMSFGFRRRPTSGIPMPITNYAGTTSEKSLLHPRSKSAGPEQDRRRMMDDDNSNVIHNSSSGRSTPRLAPPKKDSSGIGVRTNRFGYRQPQARFTNKVGDICNSHNISHYNQEKLQQYPQHQQQQPDNYFKQQQPNRVVAHVPQHLCGTTTPAKSRPLQSSNAAYGGNPMAQHADANRRASGIPEPVSRYTLHTSHLPLPQYAVRMNDSNSKVAKTVANQSRKISTSTSKGSSSSKEGSVTEDSGVSSQPTGPEDNDRFRTMDYMDDGSLRRRGIGVCRPRNLRMVVSGKSFDVRDVRDDDSTVTEISVIPLPKSFATTAASLNTGFVRERATQYQRIVNKDNRYTDSTASMSTTSSEGYDEGCLSEEKVYKDRSRTEKVPSMKSDFSPPSSDDPEYGHGEAMADEYSLSSSDEYQRTNSIIAQHAQAVTAATKGGTASKNALRSVLLTIEDPAFAAAAATTTTLIDDETSPVDSLFDSPTASITQSDGKPSKRDEEHAHERSDNTLEDDGPGTPTNASNSLSLSEGREFFDDEIADQPGLIFSDSNQRARVETPSAIGSQENSHTVVEISSKMNAAHNKRVTNSPHHGQRLRRTASLDTLSPCESIASDDLMLDYDGSDASSYEEQQRLNSNPALHELDDATIISELEAQGEEVMRQWSSLLTTAHMEEANSNSANNNSINSTTGNNNNQAATESGIGSDRMSRLLRSRSGTESPRSLDNMRNRQVSSPMRTSGSVSSSCVDSGDEASLRIDRGTYQYMFQDIVSIKTMLLKLKRVLQESGENDLTRTETLNPFDNPKNGLFCNLNEGGSSTTDVSTSPGSGGSSIADELADMRRQVVFLQGQVEDRDRTIQVRDRTIELLEVQVSKLQGPKNGDAQSCALPTRNNNVSSGDTCNATTQTEKTRPVSAGPSLLQSLPQDGVMGPLVSWSDSSDRQRPSLLSELNSAGSHRKPIERLPHTLRLRQEHTPTRRVSAHARRHSSECVSGSAVRPKDCAKSPCDMNDAEQRDTKIEGNTVKSLIPTPRKLRL
ncbi:PREDICTED: putative mediator of RNA polymerase II transcription subunit 26 isoform X2 [Wasmannia auropunctata]|uniref:putative mediator of RNA polymerase II transcription subunit 26 isoform X2 n=1 Tax=Wasmannia auropunctata TaxID=64793 RepID=UPI0005EF365C|nr:PREDICTED: putative mediator of RNA polymerase II transcription subunit 26 isoform X2 [Wasmannia auropunctata]